MPCQGHLDWPCGRDCIGWVFDPTRPGYRVRLHLFMDGALLRRRLANSYRPDLLAAGIGDGRHAFSVELPDTMFDGERHTISAALADTGETFHSYEFCSIYRGAIEDVGAQAVRIRMVDQSRPAFAVEAELWADGRFVAAGLGPDLRLPAGFDIDRVKRFELYARGCRHAVAEWVPPGAAVFIEVSMPHDDEVVDVLIYPGSEAIIPTLRTLESIAAAGNTVATQVHVILGAASGEVLRATLEDASKHRLDFQFHIETPVTAGDKIYLAAGALVSGNWIDRLRKAAYADASTATASPLTGGAVDGHSARSLDNLCRHLQPGTIAEIDIPSAVCSYQRRTGGSKNVLAGGVRVEAVSPMPLPEDRNHAAHRLRRTLEEHILTTEPLHVTASGGDVVSLNGLRYQLPADSEPLTRRLTQAIQVVDSIHYPPELFALGIPYEVEVHDYGWICPRGDLIDETGRFCGEPSIEACERCFHKLGPREGWGMLLHRCGSVAELRQQNRQILEGATLVQFPSRDAAARMSRYATPRQSTIAVATAKTFTKPSLKKGETLRISLVGVETTIWKACVFDAKKRELPLEFGSLQAVVEFWPSEAPPLQDLEFSLYPIRFDIGAEGPGLRVPCGLPASRINDRLLWEFFVG